MPSSCFLRVRRFRHRYRDVLPIERSSRSPQRRMRRGAHQWKTQGKLLLAGLLGVRIFCEVGVFVIAERVPMCVAVHSFIVDEGAAAFPPACRVHQNDMLGMGYARRLRKDWFDYSPRVRVEAAPGSRWLPRRCLPRSSYTHLAHAPLTSRLLPSTGVVAHLVASVSCATPPSVPRA